MAAPLTHKVLQIKVSKTSINAGDVSDILKNATKLRVQHVDGTVDYVIKSAQEKSTFWQFNVEVPWNVSGSNSVNVNTIVRPGLNTTFTGTDYNVLINNVDQSILSKTQQQMVDFKGTNFEITNFDNLIANNGTIAQVQPFNYQSRPFSYIRYKGSRNSSDAVNSKTTAQCKIIQRTLNKYVNPSTLKKPVVESLGSFILEFDWGGGTSPEILKSGGLNVINLMFVGDDANSIQIVDRTESDFPAMLAQALPQGSKLVIRQYNSDVNIPRVVEVLSSEIAVPYESTYMIPQSGSSYAFGIIASGSINTLRILNPLPRVEINSSGLYTTSSLYSASAKVVYDEITQGLVRGERWFVTFYERLGNTVEYTGSNAIKMLHLNSSSYTDGTFVDPLGAYGVSEISYVSAEAAPTYYDIVFKTSLPNFMQSNVLGNPGLGNDSYGALVWKSIGSSVIVRDVTLSGVAKGGAFLEHSSETVDKNFNYIAKTYGDNSN